MSVRFVKHSDIDHQKWDGCINESINGMAYAYSWYLDEVSEDWDALVLDDYSAVMPLTMARKFGVSYLYQPFFTQQLGVFSTIGLSSDMVNSFLTSIPAKIRLVDISLNTFTNAEKIAGYKITQRVTYQLDLIETYSRLYQKYGKNNQRNLAKALALQVSIVRGVGVAAFLSFTKENIKGDLPTKAMSIMGRLVSRLVSNGHGEVYGAYSQTNTLCAAALFVRYRGKSIYLLATSSQEGIANRAMFLLIDTFIQENSESATVLDFEGSSIPGVAKFYQGFGAVPVSFPHLFKHKLPLLTHLAFKAKRQLFH